MWGSLLGDFDGRAGLRRCHDGLGNSQIGKAIARTDQRLFIVTVGHERALEISALLRADSNLRVLLGEAPRDAEIIEAGTDEQAADITAAIRGDLVALGPALAAVVVR